jgi:hypothetical protein
LEVIFNLIFYIEIGYLILLWQIFQWLSTIYILSSKPLEIRELLLNETNPAMPSLTAYKKNCEFSLQNLIEKVYDVNY